MSARRPRNWRKSVKNSWTVSTELFLSSVLSSVHEAGSTEPGFLCEICLTISAAAGEFWVLDCMRINFQAFRLCGQKKGIFLHHLTLLHKMMWSCAAFFIQWTKVVIVENYEYMWWQKAMLLLSIKHRAMWERCWFKKNSSCLYFSTKFMVLSVVLFCNVTTLVVALKLWRWQQI